MIIFYTFYILDLRFGSGRAFQHLGRQPQCLACLGRSPQYSGLDLFAAISILEIVRHSFWRFSNSDRVQRGVWGF